MATGALWIQTGEAIPPGESVRVVPLADVVEALRDLASNNGHGVYSPHVSAAAKFIEERFGPRA